MNTGLLLQSAHFIFFFFFPATSQNSTLLPLWGHLYNTAHRMHVFYTTSLLLNWDVENEVMLLKAWTKKRRGQKQNTLRCRLIGVNKKYKTLKGGAGGSARRVCLRREEWTVCLWTRYMTRGQKAPHQYGRHNTYQALTKKDYDLGRPAGGRRKGRSNCLYWPGRAAKWNRNRWKCELSIRGQLRLENALHPEAASFALKNDFCLSPWALCLAGTDGHR